MNKRDDRCNPQNNMDCYYNSQWDKLHRGMPYADNFTDIQEDINKQLRDHILDLEPSGNQTTDKIIKIRDNLFRPDLDTNILHRLSRQIDAISNITELAEMIHFFDKCRMGILYSLGVEPDHYTVDTYILNVSEPNVLDISDNNLNYAYNYIESNWHYRLPNIRKFRKHYRYIYNLFDNIIIIKMDPIRMNNEIRYDDFVSKVDRYRFWRKTLGDYVISDDVINIQNMDHINLVNYILHIVHNDARFMAKLKDYMICCLYSAFEPYLSRFPYNIDSAFDSLLTNAYGPYLDKVYNEYHLNINKVDVVLDMFDKMKNMCKKLLSKTDIFTHNTRLLAIDKVSNIGLSIGSCDNVFSYDVVPGLTDDIYQNLIAINECFFLDTMSYVSKPVKRNYVSVNNNIYSFSINAHYDPVLNTIYIPTAITHDAYIDNKRDIVDNYGSIGCVIGHEIMHSFDDSGSLYDEKGRLHNWWTSTDIEKFQAEVNKVKDHYHVIAVNGINIDADKTVGENIADICGIKLSLRTYIHHYLPGYSCNSLSPYQRKKLEKFFRRWATTLRMVVSNDIIRDNVKYDVHAPNIVRINAPFAHIHEYHQVYRVKPSDDNYIEPDKRISLLD